MRRIALKNKVPNAEVQKIWKSQFGFTKELLESYSKEYLATATEEELKEIVINFLYLGKVHSAESLQQFGNKRNKLKGEKNEHTKKE